MKKSICKFIMLVIAISVIMGNLLASVSAVSFCDDEKVEIITNNAVSVASQESYLYSGNIPYECYSGLFSFTGNRLTSYISVGVSSTVNYMTIKLYRETSPSIAGRTLIKSIKIPTGTSSTQWFRDIIIIPGANYRLHFIPSPSVYTSGAPRVSVSAVSWKY